MKRYLVSLGIAGILCLGQFQLSALAKGNTTSGKNPLLTTQVTSVSDRITTTAGNAGEFLVDSQGRALYASNLDLPNTSNCTGQCAQIWTPLTTTNSEALTETANNHIDQSLIGTIQRSDGTTQVTYNQMPLYYFNSNSDENSLSSHSLDRSNSAEVWSLVNPNGTKFTSSMESSETLNNIDSNNNPSSSNSLESPELGYYNNNYYHHHDNYHHDNYHHDYDCHYWGTCNNWHNNCGYYSCYSNGYCCNYCSCYYQGWH